VADLASIAASYGQLGITIWLAFEVRDVRRWLSSHIITYHTRQQSGNEIG